MRAHHLIPAAAVPVLLLLLAGPGLARDRGHREYEGREHEEQEHEQGERRGAGDRGRGRPAAAAPSAGEALYRKECGSCHLAYPPGLLPAASWSRLLAGLERHFGQNAELEAEAAAALEGWLTSNSGSARGAEAPLRISESGYFLRKHREVSGRALARASIRTFANCAACHPGAQEWDFDEDRVNIPPR
jgi:hypothetical protein